MSELIKFFAERGLLFPIQAIIIIANVYLFAKDKFSNYLLLSLVFILSTIVLQAVRRRFLLLYPFNFRTNRESVHIDTYYLRIVLIASMLFLILGICQAYYSYFLEFDKLLRFAIPYTIVVVIIVVPLIFMFASEKLNDLIADKLKNKGPNLTLDNCPFCLSPSSIKETKIFSKDKAHIETNCLKCGKNAKYEITLRIGE